MQNIDLNYNEFKDFEIRFDNCSPAVFDNIFVIPENVSRVGILLSGGDDSLFLLSKLLDLRASRELYIHALHFSTKNNVKDTIYTKKICKIFNVNLTVKKPLDFNNNFSEVFYKTYGRFSNDPVQNLHNSGCFFLNSTFNCELILDGQYADTVFFANPHNLLAFYYGNPFLKIILTFARPFRFLLSEKSKERFNRTFDYINCKNKTDFIINLLQLNNNSNNKNVINKLLGDGVDLQKLVFIVFWIFILPSREREKYLLLDNVYCPFDNIQLAKNIYLNFDQENGIFVRKKYIHKHVNSYYSRFTFYTKTLPFENE